MVDSKHGILVLQEWYLNSFSAYHWFIDNSNNSMRLIKAHFQWSTSIPFFSGSPKHWSNLRRVLQIHLNLHLVSSVTPSCSCSSHKYKAPWVTPPFQGDYAASFSAFQPCPKSLHCHSIQNSNAQNTSKCHSSLFIYHFVRTEHHIQNWQLIKRQMPDAWLQWAECLLFPNGDVL